MSAATIHRPTALPTQRAPRPTQLRLVPPSEGPLDRPARVRSASPARSAVPTVQLTRRGRLVVLAVLVVAGIGMMIGLSGVFGSAAAGSAPSRPATRTLVVQPGQTLWSIAAQVAPNADRRDTIARIVQLNALPNSGVSAGRADRRTDALKAALEAALKHCRGPLPRTPFFGPVPPPSAGVGRGRTAEKFDRTRGASALDPWSRVGLTYPYI